ncbi:hypothetical protein AB0G54_33910 [Streptomyces yokosukanensis]|uniref:hypothetical protein n=1 Tax=Streptomyces yokosukanensis TaxID=67386 RepID=UPI003438118B
MLTEKTGRTPQDLATELAALVGLDWPWVWAGPPQGGSPAFGEWCARYGWQPQNVEGNLAVRTGTGGRLRFGSGGNWNPVTDVDTVVWDLAAATAADNEQVISAAADAWPRYLDAAAGVLGAPRWTGAWDDPDFPEPPHESYWPSRDFRLRTRRPYRFAYWQPAADGPERPYVVLDQSVSFPTWGEAAPGGSMIWLTAFRPVGDGSGRP